ncbi:MAG: molybdopterin-dependent oxidoreductase [Nitrospiria bacterium]
MSRITRRKFLKMTGIFGSTVALGTGCRPTRITQALGRAGEGRIEVDEEKWLKSICLQCPGGCGIQVKVVNGNAVKIEGNPSYPTNQGRLCPKGQAGLQVLYDPDRIKGPMRQVGERGSDRWVAISWGEAISLVAERLERIRNEERSHTLAIMGGRYRGSMHDLMNRFLTAYGSPNDLGHSSILSDGSKLAHYFTQGWANYAAYDWENVNYLVCFGASLLEAWRPTTMLLRMYGHMRRGRPGFRTKIVCVDPRFSVTASKADDWISINHGTDSALALGMAHVIVSEGLYDRSFIEERTFGFEDWQDETGNIHLGFKNMVREDYPPEIVTEITGVPAKTIMKIAREFAETKPAFAAGVRGVSMQSNGVFNCMAIHSLNALVGSIDAPGGVLKQRRPPFQPWPDVVQDDISKKGVSMPRVDSAGTAKFPFTANIYSALPDNITQAKPYPIDTLFLYYTNPLFSAPRVERYYRAFSHIPFIVSFSPFMDEATSQADLILPDHTYLERWQDDEIDPSVGFPLFGIRQPVVKPLYDTMNTADVMIKIAKAIGGSVAASFPWEDYQEMIEYRVQGVLRARKGSIMARDSEDFWDELLKNGGWWNPPYEYGKWEEVFATPSKKFEFYSQLMQQKLEEFAAKQADEHGSEIEQEWEEILRGLKLEARGDRVFMPHYEPVRYTGNHGDFPFYLSTYKTMTHAEGRGANLPWLQESFGLQVKMKWGPWLEINPQSAAELGIHDGDSVWVESKIGKIKVEARLFAGAKPDIVSMPFEYGHTKYGRWAQELGVNPNEILTPEFDYLGGLCSFYSTKVKVYKA